MIIISTQALNLLIKNHLKDDDSVVFYLGKYSKKDPKRIVRYNERNSYPYTKEKDTYTYKDLKNRTAFAMQVFGNVSSKDEKSKNSSGLFNPRIIMGAVGKGNHDVEINNRGKNNFMPEKIAVSDIYEISRLCPPPREGCFDDL